MVKINKELNRTDGGIIASGSVVAFDIIEDGQSKTVFFRIRHYVSEELKIAGKTTIYEITEFSYKNMQKQCTTEEWTTLTESAGSAALLQDWVKAIIDSEIGSGFTEII